MSNSKFFTNTEENTLFDKFRGIINGMKTLDHFNAVVGFFRSSGYFAIRNEFQRMHKLPLMKILVGINIDDIFKLHDKRKLFMPSVEDIKGEYKAFAIDDIEDAQYDEKVEEGVLQLINDIKNGTVELKIHSSGNLHAKFYLFLPENHNPHSDGWVIMGSSNLSKAGLGIDQSPRYELNLAMKDYDDVAFCKQEFDTLWNEAVELTFDDIEKVYKDTHLLNNPTPFEIYMKFLIDYFGTIIEDDFVVDLPDSMMKLKYQEDAMKDGYQKLKRYNGFFLADVVGLGKTVVAAMIAKRFIEENGRRTRILVVYPPALSQNWESTFDKFGIARNSSFIPCGSLEKLFRSTSNYHSVGEYDMVIVDEAHRFRGETSAMYDALQRVCKVPRQNQGNVDGSSKKVMLISATPLNNRPDDIYNLLQLFQSKRKCNIEGVPSLQKFFAPLISRYEKLMSSSNKNIDVSAVDEIYEEIRRDLISKITVRRTRSNIKKNPEYNTIKFPIIEPPRKRKYTLDNDMKELFAKTVVLLSDSKTGLKYARYLAIDRLADKVLAKTRYGDTKKTVDSLSGIYRTVMIKRLESSFNAFRKSLTNLRDATQGMIDMFDADKVIIQKDLKVMKLQANGMTIDEIITYGIYKLDIKESEFVYNSSDFEERFLEHELKHDIKLLNEYLELWNAVITDPKLDKFEELLKGDIFNHENPSGKVVIFSESIDTVSYLGSELARRLNRKDILVVTSTERKKLFDKIQANFDANYEQEQLDDYKIIISTDVLAEGVNLHRSNVIVNYDTPWNASRLMQRIGRVNRIGSVAGRIINYMFYPSDEGDAEIRLYKNAVAKLQGFHSALGEDSQIYSTEEMVREFELFNKEVEKDDVDYILEFQREVSKFRKQNPDEYERIKNLKVKSRTGRRADSNNNVGTTLVYLSSETNKKFYKVSEGKTSELGFLDAARLFKADADEKALPLPTNHFRDVQHARLLFGTVIEGDERIMSEPEIPKDDKRAALSMKMIRELKRSSQSLVFQKHCDILLSMVSIGEYHQVNLVLNRMSSKWNKSNDQDVDYPNEFAKLIKKYYSEVDNSTNQTTSTDKPTIILSESFV